MDDGEDGRLEELYGQKDPELQALARRLHALGWILPEEDYAQVLIEILEMLDRWDKDKISHQE